MKVAYTPHGDFNLVPYAQYLYAKAKFQNSILFVYDNNHKKLTTKEEIEDAYYIWISFKDFGDTLPLTWDDNDILDYEFCTKVRHDPLLIKTIEEYGLEKSGGDYGTISIDEINEPYVRIGNEMGEYVMTMSSGKWQGTELLNN